ncbi:MAG: hypothetical protein WDM94_04060 [Bauldia sp.]
MLTLDPKDPLHKQQIKASIVDAIAKDFVAIERGEIVEAVDGEYERLLAKAAIFGHVPSLANGAARRLLHSHHPHQDVTVH